MRRPWFDIAVMPGVSHFAMMEQPLTFNRLLQGFVNGLQRRYESQVGA